jgi:lipoyl synthase
MATLSPEAVWKTNKHQLLDLLDSGQIARKKHLNFYAPSFTYYKTNYFSSEPNLFPTISVTGSGCALNCKHCEGKILETMKSATTAEKLYQTCQRLKQKGAVGCLVSGGSQKNGSVLLNEFIPALKKIKQELNLSIHVHTGIIDYATSKALKNAGVDAALIDIVGSDETIKNVLNLNAKVEDYVSSLKNLEDSGIPFVPHVIVGLNYGQIKGEFHALEIIAQHNPSALVIIAFMPIRGTSMATIKPASPIDVARVIAAARVMLPKMPLALGCMRPKGKHRSEIDILAIKAGVSAVAFPSQEAIEYAKNQGYEASFSSYCCSQIYKDNTA